MILVQVSPNEVYMKIELSHALVDGQSTGVFSEIFARYILVQVFLLLHYHTRILLGTRVGFQQDHLKRTGLDIFPMYSLHSFLWTGVTSPYMGFIRSI